MKKNIVVCIFILGSMLLTHAQIPEFEIQLTLRPFSPFGIIETGEEMGDAIEGYELEAEVQIINLGGDAQNVGVGLVVTNDFTGEILFEQLSEVPSIGGNSGVISNGSIGAFAEGSYSVFAFVNRRTFVSGRQFDIAEQPEEDTSNNLAISPLSVVSCGPVSIDINSTDPQEVNVLQVLKAGDINLNGNITVATEEGIFILQAENRIVLGPNFRVLEGAELRASIADCATGPVAKGGNGYVPPEDPARDITIFQLDVEDNVLSGNPLIVYPNPFAEEFIIDMGNETGITDIRLYNILGQEVKMQKREDDNRNIIRTTGLSNGVYFLTMKSKNKGIISKRLIKED